MKKLLAITLLSAGITVSSQASLFGFLGDVASTAIGTSMGTKGGNAKGYENHIVVQNKIIQHTLKLLGYYTGNINGNLNTYDSRSAIENFQKIAGYTSNGIIDPQSHTFQNLLYFYELTDEFENLNFNTKENIISSFKNTIERKKNLQTAMVKLENVLFKKEKNTKLSKAMSQSILKDEKDLTTLQSNINTLIKSPTNILIDKENKLIWQDSKFSNKKYEQSQARAYCSKLNLNGLEYWRAPEIEELVSLYKRDIKFKNNPSKNDKDWPYFWSDKSRHLADFKKKKYYTGQRTYSKNFVRCVHTYE